MITEKQSQVPDLAPQSRIAVVGSGAAGLSAAWLLSQKHSVTLFEKDDRLGGHAHTALVESEAGEVAVDTGFIVYNERNYPNFTRWLDNLGVETQVSDMSFSVSRNAGQFEYKGGTWAGLFAQPVNLLRPRFYLMLRDLLRFYSSHSGSDLPAESLTLGQLLQQGAYNRHFIDDHLLPFGAAIWSTSRQKMLEFPAAAFLRFCDNHSLLSLSDRPRWRTVVGGSQSYVTAVREAIGVENVRVNQKVCNATRTNKGVLLETLEGRTEFYDHVVFATHADQTLLMLEDASAEEKKLLGAFSYEQNLAILHTDTRLLPRRRRAWASWNYMDTGFDSGKTTVSYWMNNLQNLKSTNQYIVSLNPSESPSPETILRTSVYEHPVFNVETFAAQQQLWSLQGQRGTWFCGAWFGAGFHEDAIQSGLAVAEQLGNARRPWLLSNPSSRIVVHDSPLDSSAVQSIENGSQSNPPAEKCA